VTVAPAKDNGIGILIIGTAKFRKWVENDPAMFRRPDMNRLKPLPGHGASHDREQVYSV